MGSTLNDGLLRALVTILLVVAVWVVLSGPFYLIKRTLQKAGVSDFVRSASDEARRRGFKAGASAFFEQIRMALELNSDGHEVRIAIAERQAALGAALRRSEEAIERATGDVRGLSAIDGPNTLLGAIKDLHSKVKVVEGIAVEFETDLEEKYRDRAKYESMMGTLLFAAIVFVSLNGFSLNLFFKGVVSTKIAGIPWSMIASGGFVAAEMILGFVLASRAALGMPKAVGWLILFFLSILGFIEAAVLGMVSAGFNLELLDGFPDWAKFWLAPFGFVLVGATSMTGFGLHKAKERLDECQGTDRLRKEVKQAKDFVDGLPPLWDKIGQRAKDAEAQIKGFISTLAGQDDRITSAVGRIGEQRELLIVAIRQAKVDDWPAVVEGASGDRRRASAQNIAWFLFTVVTCGAFAAVVTAFVTSAFGLKLDLATGVRLGLGGVIGVLVTAGFYSVGLLSFQRIPLIQDRRGEALPIPGGTAAYALAVLIVLGGAGVIVTAAGTAPGSSGPMLGLVVAACGGAVAFCGYGMERCLRGLMLCATVITSFVVNVVGGLWNAFCTCVLWAVTAAAWLITFLVGLVAAPCDMLIQWLSERKRAVA